jgi:endonuclease YncB( thermonuclease family)
VIKILDGASFVIDDGREVRLAGVEVPPTPAEIDPAAAPPEFAAKAELSQLLVGSTVELRHHTVSIDRYGRTVAQAYVAREGVEHSAVHDLLATGVARVAARVGNAACAAELLSRERVARAKMLGIWADPSYAIVAAQDFTKLLASEGRFTLAEGKVLSVRATGGVIYMNFGIRWSQALTVTVMKRDERIFAGAGVVPKKLENRRIRVRGWVMARNGPRIEASRPEQIELAEN